LRLSNDTLVLGLNEAEVRHEDTVRYGLDKHLRQASMNGTRQGITTWCVKVMDSRQEIYDTSA
jgi:hypothetical protein